METQDERAEFAESAKVVRRDAVKVIITNVFILALLFALYFVNKRTGSAAGLGKFFLK